MTLLQPYFKKGYNVTTDNYSTSLKLADELKQRKTTILGTIRKQQREMPNTASHYILLRSILHYVVAA